ncbi:MAG: mhpA 1, partial [Flaviaesturariibacter sp.]|nr:mhpA 1 [Flaviaesturariibacter sp.]
LLHRRTQLLDTVELNQGWEAVGYSEGKDYATLTVQAGTPCVTGNQTSAGQQRVVTARYVVGADGANSFVRRATGMGWTDLGFRADWLVIDYKPNDPTKELDMPEAGQICDPARPITLMRHMGRKHVRWEVMLLPGETAADLTQPAMVWSLIDRWVKPSDGEITRAAVYTFQSGVAASWVKGRSILVGDAAHLMPPFLGQGLCSGLRDARSAFWRLDLILGGLAEPDLLESYQKERNEHVTCVIARAVALGKVLCITDPQEAAKRDAAILGGTAPAIPPFPGLANGLLHRSVSGAVAEPVGQLSLQAQIKLDGQVGRLDDLTGSSWVVLALGSADEFTLDDSQKAFAKQLGMRIVRLDDEDTDFHGKYHAYMNALGVEALIVRPDFYVFGASHTVQDVPGMLDELKRQLPLTGQPNKTKATANSN